MHLRLMMLAMVVLYAALWWIASPLDASADVKQALSLNKQGEKLLNQGDYAGAREYYEASLELRQEIGDPRGQGLILHNLGALALAEGDLDEAETYFCQALTLHEELGLPQYVAEDQAGLAGVALERGEPATAREALTPVLAYLAENPTLNGAEHPYRAFLICGQVLRAVGEVTRGREIVGAAHARLVTLAEKLPIPAERERFWQAPHYAALRRLWAELAE